MSVTGQQISDSAGILLQDVTSIRWSSSERLVWINDGRRQMANIRPEIFGAGTEVAHTLVGGARQRIAATNALKLISVDSHAGIAVLPTTRQALDSFRPGWRSDVAKVVDNWFPDETDPLAFWIHPASTGEMRCHIHLMPADLSALSEVAIPFDTYGPHLVNYLCFRCLSKDAEYAGNAQAAAAYYQLFTSALTGA